MLYDWFHMSVIFPHLFPLCLSQHVHWATDRGRADTASPKNERFVTSINKRFRSFVRSFIYSSVCSFTSHSESCKAFWYGLRHHDRWWRSTHGEGGSNSYAQGVRLGFQLEEGVRPHLFLICVGFTSRNWIFKQPLEVLFSQNILNSSLENLRHLSQRNLENILRLVTCLQFVAAGLSSTLIESFWLVVLYLVFKVKL